MARFFEFNEEEVSVLIEACEDKIFNLGEMIISIERNPWSESFMRDKLNEYESLKSLLCSFKGGVKNE